MIAAQWFTHTPKDRKKMIKIKSHSNTHDFSNWVTINHWVSKINSRAPVFHNIHSLSSPTMNNLSKPIIFAHISSVIIPSQNFDDFSRMSDIAPLVCFNGLLLIDLT
jgi:hypothetical protein